MTNTERIMMLAIEEGYVDVAKAMLKKGANICAERNFALKVAAVKADAEMFRFLTDNGADIHYDNDRLIRDMAEDDDLPAVKVLAELGADVCAQNDFPLQVAVINGNADMVRYLISKGAGKNNKVLFKDLAKIGKGEVAEIIKENLR